MISRTGGTIVSEGEGLPGFGLEAGNCTLRVVLLVVEYMSAGPFLASLLLGPPYFDESDPPEVEHSHKIEWVDQRE